MEKAIRAFAKQFAWNPEVENGDKLGSFDSFVLVGMGGSHLAGGIIASWRPELDLRVRQNYGAGPLASKDRLTVCSSYSGNTEEVLAAFTEVVEKGFAVAAVSTGGELLRQAELARVPFVRIPDTGIQPRTALGFGLRGVLKLMGRDDLVKETDELASLLKPDELEEQGKKLAGELKGRVPVVYASDENRSLAYNWKIKFNETGKIPAFWNVFPELNHNELAGMDVADATRELSGRLHFVFLKDEEDDPRIKRRMEVTERLYQDRGLKTAAVELTGRSRIQRLFASLLAADWTALHTARLYGTEPNAVPIIEEFKKSIA